MMTASSILIQKILCSTASTSHIPLAESPMVLKLDRTAAFLIWRRHAKHESGKMRMSVVLPILRTQLQSYPHSMPMICFRKHKNENFAPTLGLQEWILLQCVHFLDPERTKILIGMSVVTSVSSSLPGIYVSSSRNRTASTDEARYLF